MYSLNESFTKEFILSKISEEQIMERYLGIPVVFGKLVTSPLRKDENPTCGFSYTNQALYFRDFSGHFFGNCFDVVMYKYNCSLAKACEIVATDFGLKSGTSESPTRASQSEIIMKVMQSARADFAYVPRLYNELDAKYWTKFGITRKALDFYNVVPVKKMYHNKLEKYTYNAYDPCYVYVIRPNHYKFYFPFRKINDKGARFLSNTDLIQGYDNLPDFGDVLVITKSMKDILVFYEADLWAIAWQGESVIPDSKTIEELRQRFKIIVSLYDFDATGVRTANILRKRHLIYPFFITDGRFGSSNYGAKDPAEFVQVHGKEKFHEAIEKIKQIFEWEKLLSMYQNT